MSNTNTWIAKALNFDINNLPTIIHCSICGTIHANVNTKEELIRELYNAIENGWEYNDDKLYCKECIKQQKVLKSIGQNQIRPTKANYYLDIAKAVSKRSTCLRKQYGAVIVKDDVIVSTGYNGAPRMRKNCIDLCTCRREELGVKRGERYELCRAIHAEANAIINASKEQLKDSVLFLYGYDLTNNIVVEELDSCQMCKKLIINAGIKEVIVPRDDYYRIIDVQEWIDFDDSLSDKLGY